MQDSKRKTHEIENDRDDLKSSDLFFGLSGLGVNTTKENKRRQSGNKEDKTK